MIEFNLIQTAKVFSSIYHTEYHKEQMRKSISQYNEELSVHCDI